MSFYRAKDAHKRAKYRRLRPCRRFLVAALAIILGLLPGCDRPPSEPVVQGRSDAQLLADNTLKVLTLNSPTTYFFDNENNATGPEYDLLHAFAEESNLEFDITVAGSVKELLALLDSGDYDLAAANLTATRRRARHYRFGPAYQKVKQQVVCRRDGNRANSVDTLTDVNLAVVSHSSYEETLQSLVGNHPALSWDSIEDAGSEDMLESVWAREIDCTVGDSNIIEINRRYFPELQVMFDLTDTEHFVWLLRPNAEHLQKMLDQWFVEFKNDGQFALWREKYYGFVKIFDYVDTVKYVKRIEKRFPKYREMFERAAKEHDLDMYLLAAQSYQESHWRPRAKSPTGVRGMMMLTLPTAKQLGVKSRLDPWQSINGGAKYLKQLKERIDGNVQEPDRTWQALAAYNMGMGHLRDARLLTKQLGKNPDNWQDLKTVLPLLSQKKYHKNLPYGYARGHEAVRYVQRIREYKHILENQLPLLTETTAKNESDRPTTDVESPRL